MLQPGKRPPFRVRPDGYPGYRAEQATTDAPATLALHA
jgi:hypothetical protein